MNRPSRRKAKEKLFLHDYFGQSVQQLIAMKATHRVDSLVLAVEQALDGRTYAEYTEAERVVLAVEAMEREVNNGGYEQFFGNSCEHASCLVRSLKLIGCPKTAAISADAIAVLRLPKKFDGDDVQEAASELSAKDSARLSECDWRCYDTKEDIEGQLFAYIEKHQHEIRIPAEGCTALQRLWSLHRGQRFAIPEPGPSTLKRPVRKRGGATRFRPDDEVREIAEACALDAYDLLRKDCGITLDWSDSSVQHVESVMGALHAQLASAHPSAEQVTGLSAMFGSYIGEVYRKNHGGTWGMVLASRRRFPGLKPRKSGALFLPWGRARDRLMDGEGHNVWRHYSAFIAERDGAEG